MINISYFFIISSVKVMCETQNQRSNNSVKSHVDSRTKATITTPKETLTSNVIGFCNLDLMPILLGSDFH